MIKKYNQFIKGKLNEDFTMAEPEIEVKPETETETETETRPKPPSPFKDPSEAPAPAKAVLDEQEEEGGQYIGKMMMDKLANELGTEISADGSINYNGQKINFYSETERFHIGKKKFETPEQVVSYLNSEEAPKMETENELDNELEDFEEEKFESKSYRKSRLKKFNK